MRDAYKVLQVDSEADLDVIQAAYRRLAQKFHPDLAGGSDAPDGRAAAERMVAINAAWEILRDPSRRAAYDRERAAGPGSGSAAGGGVAPAAHASQTSQASPPGSGRRRRSVGSGSAVVGRYAGWKLGDIVHADPGYLEWLGRTPAGRPYKAEIENLLRRTGRAATGTTRGLPRR